MKKSEKQMIAILIVIAIIIVGVLAAVRLRKDDETTGNRINTGSINTNTNTNNSSVSNEPEEEFVSKQEDGTRVNT